jgi:hypothetical protein
MVDSSLQLSQSETTSSRRIFVRWERWRIAYNLVLICVVGLLAVAGGGSDSDWRRFVAQCAFGAVLANLCYFAGPITDAYFQWLGFRHRALMPLLFVAGLTIASGLAFLVVTSSLIPF